MPAHGRDAFATSVFRGKPEMKTRSVRTLAVLACGILGAAACADAMAADSDAAAGASALSTQRDGSHDFDFDFGVWKTHITRRVHPLSGADEWMQLTGTVCVRKVWQGKAALEEIEADGPKGHWEGMFAGGLVGSFHDGRGELYSQDTLDGRSILVRGTWSDIKPTSHRYEEAYSTDGGKTWELQFRADLTKVTS
jgi:hypothetical protein